MTTGINSTSPSAASEASFPTPAETPIRHLSGDMSRRWQERSGSSSTPSSLSPTSMPNRGFSPDRNSDDIEDEGLRPFDPRRFTPTLHASLVGEILNLRREAESKSKSIDILERSLDECRTENEGLTASLSQSTKETRSLKHQLKLLEGGSSSALTELAKERDEALDSLSDIRKKLDQTQKKARSRDEDVERTQSLWDRERESWDGERRNLECKVHVVENRLKTVLNEVAAAQAARSHSHSFNNETPKAEINEHHLKDNSDTASLYSSSQGRRRTSMTSISSDEGDMHNARYSVMSLANVQGNKSENSVNLAQELEFDDDEEFVTFDDDDSISDSPGALPEEARPASSHSQMSHIVGMKARKILGLGLSLQGHRGSGDADVPESLKSPSKIPLPPSPHVYRDVGTQYSPPPSPKAQRLPASNQAKDSSTLTLAIDMVSASCQTVGDLPTPPYTPKLPESPTSPRSVPAQVITMVPACTQTESIPSTPPETRKKRTTLSPQDALSSGMEIPTIAIHPPGSEPPSPRSSVVLPPQTKSASCQTTAPITQGQSIAIQTEEIRIDQRPMKLPASLLPSAIPDLPLRNEARVAPTQPFRMPLPRASKEEKRPHPPHVPRPSVERRSTDSGDRPPLGRIQAYPGNNDNGPLSKGGKPGMRRPPRTSSLFAGFENLSDEETSEKNKGDIFSDDELMNRPTATYTLRKGKMVSTAQHRPPLDNTTLPEIEEHLSDAKMQLESSKSNDAESVGSSRSGGGRSASVARQQDIRRAAMITSGAAAHQKKRAHSASDPSTNSGSTTSVAPPFPVPIRRSSKRFPANGSDGRQSPTPSYGSRNFGDRPRPPITRKPTLRRVRSATTVSQGSQPDVFGSFSSPGVSMSSGGTDSPRRPSPPFDDIIEDQPHPSQRRQSIWRDVAYGGVASINHGNGSGSGSGSGSMFDRERQDSTATSIQQTSVVDAIAQTMVGEWMFKYIRRRPFGSSGEPKESWEGRNADEVSARITNSGARHKRWIWLAPYERAIMWSSKQPTSGSALLGKTGRKFTIQSVLDVKDDNPLPKGSSPQSQFNRSILVLTPQRALKFTATSVERHYVWLTALSFLSHSSMGLDEIANLPPIPLAQGDLTSPVSASGTRKNPIRESFGKAAKGFPRAYPKRPFASSNKPAPVPEVPMDDDDSLFDAAAPPTVPMFSTRHTRKRSNTAPRMPSMRNFSAIGPVSTNNNNNSFDAIYPPSIPTNGANSTRTSISRRTSETSGPSSSVNGSATSNFFDAIGTVRMEAFVDRTDANRPRGGSGQPRHRRKPSSSHWSSGLSGSGFGYGQLKGSFETFSSPRFEDPFRGF